MSWQPHGSSKSGFTQTCHHGQSRTTPAVVGHRGRLWCMWPDLSGEIWYACTNENEAEFLPRKSLGLRGVPLMTILNGHMHAIIAIDTDHMIHFVFDDENTSDWVGLGMVSRGQPFPGLLPDPFPESKPSLASFQGKLFITYANHGLLYYTIWDASTANPDADLYPHGTWRAPEHVPFRRPAPIEGIPSLAVIEGTLHLLFETKGRAQSPAQLLCYTWDHFNSTWQEVCGMPKNFVTGGISATSYGDTTYLGFIRDSQNIYLSTLQKPATAKVDPQEPESIAKQTASDPPQLAILNGRIHCIFNDDTPSKDLRWYSRPILTYSLSSWMSSIPSPTLLSQLTIPGTHDSCARSNIPYVRTQYLSISQQLALGIRFLDLRLRRHDDNQLYLYHGGVPLGLPGRLSFQSVMDEVWAFLQASPSETVLVSIDNDDNSPSQKTSPEIFYRAVEFAVLTTPYYEDGSPRWFTDFSTTPNPTLGQVRGRAVLLRRYLPEPATPPRACLGLDLSAWVNDSPEFTIITPSGTRVHLQDKWRFSERISLQDLIAAKSRFVQNLMSRATGKPPSVSPPPRPDPENEDGDEDEDTAQDWYINFCSAVGDPTTRGEVAQAKWVAVGARSGWVGGKWIEGMNIVTREFVQARREEEELLRDGDDNDDDDITDDRSGINSVLPPSKRTSAANGHHNGGGTGKGRVIGKRRWYRLGIVNLDYPELPVENDIVTRLIEVNFLNF